MTEPGKLDEELDALLRRHARQRVLARGEALGPVTVVQSSGDAGRSRRLAALASPGESLLPAADVALP